MEQEQSCQLCGQTNLAPFVVPGQLNLWLCRDCELYQYGQLPENSAYDGDYHDGYERNRASKVRTARIRLNLVAALFDQSAKRNRPLRVLDVGCSVGCILEAAEERGWEAVGVDVSKLMVHYCNARGLRAELVDSARLPFEDESFDILTSWHVIEHVQDVRETLIEWKRVLRPDGVIALETPDGASPKVRRLGAKYRKFWAPEHTYTFTKQNLGEFVSQVGLQPCDGPVLGNLTDLGPAMASYTVMYQTYHQLRRLAGIQKAFQLYARKAG